MSEHTPDRPQDEGAEVQAHSLNIHGPEEASEVEAHMFKVGQPEDEGHVYEAERGPDDPEAGSLNSH